MKSPKFSIIIPVYNSSSVLDICLDSVLKQTINDYEVICINDGSTDDSLKILDKYSRLDNRIKVFDIKNGGVSRARNEGLKKASGEYVLFLDSDDWIHKRALEKVNDTIKDGVDCVIFPMIDVYPNKEFRNNTQLDKLYGKFGSKAFSLEEAGLDLIYSFGGMSTKVTRRDFLNKNKIKFNETLKVTEDLCVSLEVLAKAEKIKLINYAIYYYRKPMKGGTLTTTHLREVKKALEYSYSQLSNYYRREDLVDRFINTMIYIYERDDYIKDPESFSILQSYLTELDSNRKTRNYNKLRKIVRGRGKVRECVKKFKETFNKLAKINDSLIKKEFKFSIKHWIIWSRYERNILRINKKIAKGGKISVCFLFNEYSKIKTNSLIQRLYDDERFEVSIAVTTLMGVPYHSQQRLVLNAIVEYYSKRNIPIIKAYDEENGRPISLPSTIDILFYQQPWQIQGVHQIKKVSKHAITCYVPYFVPNYGYTNMDCMNFHKLLFRYYVLNDDYNKLYYEAMSPYNKQLRVVGHTELDYFINKDIKLSGEYVIYAPHWSIGNGTEKYSTFIWSGYYMLWFAKKHPEFKWVFKPHPTLKKELLKKSILSQEEIQDYYNEWKKISIIHEGPDYLDLFNKSKCLITDSASFLVEYFLTGCPVIKLSSNLPKQPCDALKRLTKYYYNVDCLTELEETLHKILVEGDDVIKPYRIQAVNDFKSSLKGESSLRIVKDLEEIFF